MIIFGFTLDPTVTTIIVLVIGLSLVLYLIQQTRTAGKTLAEVQKAGPTLLAIAREYTSDGGSTLKDTTNRLEATNARMEETNALLQKSVEHIIAEQQRQAFVNDQVDALMARLLSNLNSLQEDVTRKGEISAALALEKLIAQLHVERERLALVGGVHVSIGGDATGGSKSQG